MRNVAAYVNDLDARGATAQVPSRLGLGARTAPASPALPSSHGQPVTPISEQPSRNSYFGPDAYDVHADASSQGADAGSAAPTSLAPKDQQDSASRSPRSPLSLALPMAAWASRSLPRTGSDPVGSGETSSTSSHAQVASSTTLLSPTNGRSRRSHKSDRAQPRSASMGRRTFRPLFSRRQSVSETSPSNSNLGKGKQVAGLGLSIAPPCHPHPSLLPSPTASTQSADGYRGTTKTSNDIWAPVSTPRASMDREESRDPRAPDFQLPEPAVDGRGPTYARTGELPRPAGERMAVALATSSSTPPVPSHPASSSKPKETLLPHFRSSPSSKPEPACHRGANVGTTCSQRWPTYEWDALPPNWPFDQPDRQGVTPNSTTTRLPLPKRGWTSPSSVLTAPSFEARSQ